MMVLLSPSKTMELTSHPTLTPSQPVFEEVGAGDLERDSECKER